MFSWPKNKPLTHGPISGGACISDMPVEDEFYEISLPAATVSIAIPEPDSEARTPEVGVRIAINRSRVVSVSRRSVRSGRTILSVAGTGLSIAGTGTASEALLAVVLWRRGLKHYVGRVDGDGSLQQESKRHFRIDNGGMSAREQHANGGSHQTGSGTHARPHSAVHSGADRSA